ncbi:MAG: sigma 54-interacting transcriptional regulator [Candidatus Eisenbacteria sp.]|nr:sigma 54-interacting transcriptional regulator [Candidatus Eisenbacteria bacterium]
MKETAFKSRQDVILDSINEGVFTVDLNWRIESFNQAAENITGVKREDAIGHPCNEVFRASICENACALRKTLATGRPTVDTTVYIVDATGNRIPIQISAAVLRDKEGQIMGGVETFQDLRQVEELRKRLQEKHTFADIVGKSPAITQLFDILPQIADSESNVLIDGASGTGKELFARAIHDLSSRPKKLFVAVNCGALPDTLLESELFGYKAGAFTDAKRDKHGRFALANGGTLFLDEIGDISPAMQVRLLRVLQERTFEPLGSIEPVRSNARVIASTNKDLRKLVRDGNFRQDLFYRIHVVHIEIPSLRSRREDIPLLLEHFIAKFNRLQGKHVTGLSQEVLPILMEHDYPGNVRELQNIVEHTFVLCRSGPIQFQHLPPYLRGKAVHSKSSLCGTNLKSMEKVFIAETLRKRNGNRTLAAKDLGINVSTLYRKIRALKIEVPETDGRRKSLR